MHTDASRWVGDPSRGRCGAFLVPITAQAKAARLNFPSLGLGVVIWKTITIWSNKDLTPREERFKFGERNVGILSWVSLRQLKKQEGLQRKKKMQTQSKGAWGL